MKKLIRPLALSAVLGTGGILGTNLLLADEKPAKVDPPPVKVLPADPIKPAPAEVAAACCLALARQPDGRFQAEYRCGPGEVGETIAKTDFAVKPKALGDQVKKGLEYLVKAQQDDGGWNQGGGWRTGDGGRVEGARSKTRRTSATPASALLAACSAPATP